MHRREPCVRAAFRSFRRRSARARRAARPAGRSRGRAFLRPRWIDAMRPVRLTVSPSLIRSVGPSSTAPTLSSSRFITTALMPLSNSSSSSASAFCQSVDAGHAVAHLEHRAHLVEPQFRYRSPRAASAARPTPRLPLILSDIPFNFYSLTFPGPALTRSDDPPVASRRTARLMSAQLRRNAGVQPHRSSSRRRIRRSGPGFTGSLAARRFPRVLRLDPAPSGGCSVVGRPPGRPSPACPC